MSSYYIYTIYNYIYIYHNYVSWEQPYEIIWVKNLTCVQALALPSCPYRSFMWHLGSTQAPHGYPMVSRFSLAESPCVYWYHYWLVVCLFFKISSQFFPYIGNNHPNWPIFFRGVETTNQIIIHCLHVIIIWYIVCFTCNYDCIIIRMFVDLSYHTIIHISTLLCFCWAY